MVSAANDASRQVSHDYQNALLTALQTAINAGGGGSGPWFNIESYLDPARVPFVTDDLPATQAAINAIAAITAGPFQGVSRLQFPGGLFHWSTTPSIPNCIRLEGAGSAQTGGGGTLIRISSDNSALDLGGAGSIVDGFQFWGKNVSVNGAGTITGYGNGTGPAAIGLKVSNDFIEIKDVQCVFFGGGGFLANADGLAEANSAVFWRCQALYNGGHGIEFSGSDGNAGGALFCSAIENAGVGIFDFSFLGNGPSNNHTRGNSISDPTGCNNPTGTCSYVSSAWYVVAGQETAASTTIPGTNSAVWVAFSGPYGSMRPWVSGMTWIPCGSYANNPANRNSYNSVWLNNYAETSQPPAQVSYPAQMIGGLLGNGNVGSAPQLKASSNAFTGGSAWVTSTDAASNRYSFFGNFDGVTSLGNIFGHFDGTRLWKAYDSGGNVNFDRGGGIQFQWTANGFNLNSGMSLYNNGTKVVGAQGAAVADATDAASAITQLNTLLARCRAHGLIA